MTWQAGSKQQDLEQQINADDSSKKSQATLSGKCIVTGVHREIKYIYVRLHFLTLKQSLFCQFPLRFGLFVFVFVVFERDLKNKKTLTSGTAYTVLSMLTVFSASQS